MQAPEITDASKLFTQKVCEEVSSALAGTCHMDWKVSLATDPSGAQPEAHNCANYRFNFEGSLEGEAFLVIPRDVLGRLAVRDTNEHDQGALIWALLNAFKGRASDLSDSIKPGGGLQIESADNPDLPRQHMLELWAQSNPDDPGSRISFFLCISDHLYSKVQALDPKPFDFPDAAGESNTANLGLVMDVELNVTLRFGQRQLALRDVLELASGSVVELDRQVDEPVELILDGRVVARGEAVIIDGNYGMRITQVLHQLVP